VNSISLSARAGGCRSVRNHASVNSKNLPGSIHNINFPIFCYNQKQPQPLIYAVTAIKIPKRFHNLIIYHNGVMGLIQARLISISEKTSMMSKRQFNVILCWLIFYNNINILNIN